MDKLRVIKLVMRNPVQLWPSWEEIEWLIETVEQLQEENGTMAEKHAEKDIAMADFMEIIDQYKLQEELLLERLKKQTLQMKEMKRNSRLIKFYEMAEENLSLATELAMLKGEMSG
jgi:hypothetical protein